VAADLQACLCLANSLLCMLLSWQTRKRHCIS